jgi:NAD-dependent SIR2 family protein deacetylase
VDEAECLLINMPPPCKECGDYARPNILMFGDWGWVKMRTRRQSARQHEWLSTVQRPVVIELGAGIHIPSVRNFSKKIVEQFNGRLIRINPSDSDVDNSEDVGLSCGALEGLRAIANFLNLKL